MKRRTIREVLEFCERREEYYRYLEPGATEAYAEVIDFINGKKIDELT